MGPMVGWGTGLRKKMFIQTVYKRIFMNFREEFVSNGWNLYTHSISYCFSSEKPNLYWFWQGIRETKIDLFWHGVRGRNTFYVLTGGPSQTNPPPPDRPCPPMGITRGIWNSNVNNRNEAVMPTERYNMMDLKQRHGETLRGMSNLAGKLNV